MMIKTAPVCHSGLCTVYARTACDSVVGTGRSSGLVKKRLMPHRPEITVKNGELLLPPSVTPVPTGRGFQDQRKY